MGWTFGKKEIAASSSMPASCHQRSSRKDKQDKCKWGTGVFGSAALGNLFVLCSCTLRQLPSSWYWQIRTNFHEELAFYHKWIGRSPATFLPKKLETVCAKLQMIDFALQLPEYSFTGSRNYSLLGCVLRLANRKQEKGESSPVACGWYANWSGVQSVLIGCDPGHGYEAI